jgi:hypothetical protein
MEDVTVEKPGQHMIRETVTKWIAYGLQESRATATPLVDHQQMLSQYRAQLCEIMAPLGHALYVAFCSSFIPFHPIFLSSLPYTGSYIVLQIRMVKAVNKSSPKVKQNIHRQTSFLEE